MRVSNIRIGTRLAIAFGSLIVLIACMAGAGVYASISIRGDLHAITQVHNVKVGLAYGLIEQVHVQQRVARTLILLEDSDQKRTEAAKIRKARDTYSEFWEQLTALSAGDQAQAARLVSVEADRMAANGINGKVMIMALANRDDEARDLLLQEGIAANNKWIDSVHAVVKDMEAQTAARVEQAEASFLFGLWALGIMGVLAVGWGLMAGRFITLSVTRPIEYATECALRMAEGDLAQPVERRIGFKGRDETSRLIAAMQKMHENISAMVTSVTQTASSVATAAQQIASGNADLSSRTEQQAASLQETAATMDELTSTVRHNSDNTAQAVELAAGASSVATRGGSVMEQVVQTMGGIENSSKKIADITSVIDGIAFQTNILALNAAVEAARAGEQGRGFAVVASEVRSLAQRSGAAAREIKSLIGSSVEQVSAGTSLVETAGQTMAEIVSSIERVNRFIAEIRTATAEQSNGIAQVGTAVNDMDRTTQQNAALVEQSAAAAESLNQQAQALVAEVSKFRLAHA